MVNATIPRQEEPDEKRVFSYTLSRARRLSENAFALLAARWRLYHMAIQLKPDNMDKIILATCVLHNFLQKAAYLGFNGSVLERHRNEEKSSPLRELTRIGFHSSHDACQVRDTFKDYFSSPAGSLPC